MAVVKWFNADENNDGIKTIGFVQIDKQTNTGRIAGYNGICIGEKVEYKGKKYTVVMASRLGDFGLSKTGKLPYTIRVSPNDVEVVE